MAARKSTPNKARTTGAARRGGRTAAGNKTVQQPAPAYHHGDLRNALLAATEALLTENGLEGFTLREVARRAGVSHGAPAHHFGDVRGLLTDFTAESFAQMASAMAARRATTPPSTFEQLVSVGVAYVEYALGHRARFQLMFRSDRIDHTYPPLRDSAASAYQHLVDCMTALARESGAPDHRIAEKTALAWSLVHGFATLMIDNAMFASQAQGDPARALAMIESLLSLSRPGFEAGAVVVKKRRRTAPRRPVALHPKAHRRAVRARSTHK